MEDSFAKGLQVLPLVCKYPDLWMPITLDGYGYHFQGEALKLFADHKILIVKEEGDMSQVCQAYDKDVSLSNKRHHRRFLNGIMVDISMVDQWTLIIVAKKVCTFFILFYVVTTIMP